MRGNEAAGELEPTLEAGPGSSGPASSEIEPRGSPAARSPHPTTTELPAAADASHLASAVDHRQTGRALLRVLPTTMLRRARPGSKRHQPGESAPTQRGRPRRSPTRGGEPGSQRIGPADASFKRASPQNADVGFGSSPVVIARSGESPPDVRKRVTRREITAVDAVEVAGGGLYAAFGAAPEIRS